MNDSASAVPPLPVPEPPSPDTSASQPIAGLTGAIESLLRQPRRIYLNLCGVDAGRIAGALFAIALASSVIYGFIAGTFSGGLQLWAAPVKITGGLLFAGVICLPSLYVFSCLAGATAGLRQMIGLIAGLLALTALLLVSFAPVAWVFSQSTESVVAMGTLHLIFWGVATLFGLRFLQAGFEHHQARTNAGLGVWMVVFLMVCLQLTTALRPILGRADTFLPTEKKFFVTHWGDSIRDSKPKSAEPGR
jgi:hypothetical protein